MKAFPQDKSDVIVLFPACRWSRAPRERPRANDLKDAGVHVPLLIDCAMRSEETTKAHNGFAFSFSIQIERAGLHNVTYTYAVWY
jgi:hypothetical protein